MVITKLTHPEFVQYLIREMLPLDADTVLYGYQKTGFYSTTYFHTEDVIQDGKNHGIVFEKEPRFDAELSEVVDNLNKFVFEESKTETRVVGIEQTSRASGVRDLTGACVVSLTIKEK